MKVFKKIVSPAIREHFIGLSSNFVEEKILILAKHPPELSSLVGI